jgi:predicted MPP superfamily phosphohydrolase
MRILRFVFVFGAALVAALFIYAWQVEPKRLEVRRMTIGQGDAVLRVALVADLHFGGIHLSPGRVREIVKRINREQVDVTLIPGDFINGHTARAEMITEDLAEISDSFLALQAINSRLVATLGNHDTWHGVEAVRVSLERVGFVVLDNQSLRIDGFCYVGLADSDTASPSRDAFNGCETGDTIIALMHSPDARHLLPGNTALAVAGHTHGGQVNLPILGRAVTSTQCGKPCAYGLIQNRPPLIVSSGIGTSILPIRFRAAPEIVIIDLRE